MKKRILTVSAMIMLAGCGDFEWFPEEKPATTITASTPTADSSTFTNQCGVQTSTQITSNAVTVSGITGPTSISVSNNNDSQYSINDGPFTSSAGNVSSGQSVRVRHISAADTGTENSIVTTTLTIGGGNSTFKTDTNPCP
ncbi:hypothetical protein [Geotalea uraniireducens]|uniref:Uncharacterized protein n=1 Tax=Geotalea uraniireducens (strain Rf4) TaxID=351605 RepID=A5G553_GEOUR|nr:hypothetical protein [Geotalea uraniireducens]ABQ26921.1 hypothetical protein Gura_2747 [Geotalea uraniireducens Rf4]